MNIFNKYKPYFILLMAVMSVFIINLGYFIPRFMAVQDVAVIVRSVGEQTEEMLLDDMRRIFGDENVYLIKNVTPESKASATIMELIPTINKHWILCVDADILVFEDKLLAFIMEAKKTVKKIPKAFSFKGLFGDKIYQKDRFVGFMLYYKDNLKYSTQMADLCKNNVFPDTCIRYKMLENGFDMVGLEDVRIGIHAYYQYPEDDIKNGIMYYVKEPSSKYDIRSLWKNNEDCEYLLLGAKIYDDLKKKNQVPKIPDDKVLKQIISQYDIKPSATYQPEYIKKDMKRFDVTKPNEKFKIRIIHINNF